MESPKILTTDYLVVGSGLAGLSFALEAKAVDKVMIVSKGELTESSSSMAKGGIAAAIGPDDSWLSHFSDTLKCGSFLSEKNITRDIIQRAPESVNQLINLGCRFDRFPDGALELSREGGHSTDRIVHKGDASGKEIIGKLLKACRKNDHVDMYQYFFAKELLTAFENGKKICVGIAGYDLKSKEEVHIYARATILCTGGAGQIYSVTSNSTFITGDGYAMAHRAGAKMRNMAYVQFHPTALATGKNYELITEAVRGAGARLLNIHEKPFMHEYSPLCELATRDIVSRAIYFELKKTAAPHVYLDLRMIGKKLNTQFPELIKTCKDAGLDPQIDLIPVCPAAHYFCGGIATNSSGATSIKGLFATGEVACTGFHGANRLASNSLLEAWVMGKKCYQAAREVPKNQEYMHCPQTGNVKVQFSRKSLQTVMWENAGIVKHNAGLSKASDILKRIQTAVEYGTNIPFSLHDWETYNLLSTGLTVIKDARMKKKNAGVFYNASLT